VVSTAVPGVTTYYVSQNLNGCESARASINVYVNAKPAPPVTNTVHYCKGDNAVPLTATGTNLKWYTTPAGGGGSTIAPTPGTYVTGTTTYYVTQSVGNCESDRAAITVTVDDKVTAAIAVSKSTVCQYDTLTLLFAGGAPPAAAFNWGLNGGTLVSGSGAGPLVVRWNTPGQKTVTMTVSNGYCVATTTYLITVRPAPSADFKLPKDVCIDELVHIQASDSAQGYSDYLWNFAGATIYGGGGAGVYLLSWSTPGNKIVTLNTISGICKSATHADTLTVHDHPAAKITSVSKTDVCSGDSVELHAAVYQGYKYQWSPAAFFTDTQSPDAAAVVLVPGYIHLTVTDKYGCKAADSVLVNAQPCCQVYLPNAFSPNGDGKNDVFRVITIGHHQIGSFRVVNRWGQTVFETADERHGWDGTLNGTPQEIGTYFYYLKYKCADGQELEQKGEIILVR
jgi:gliding motility-associated-like protein